MSTNFADFVHLRLHTEYSLVDSVVRVDDLMATVAAAHMPAVALTDQCNLFAMVKFYRAALERGIQPIIGADLLLRESEEAQRPSRLTVLCQSTIGYRNLSRLLSRAYLEGQSAAGAALIDRAWLDRDSTAGLIALSGAAEGDIGRALLRERAAQAEQLLDGWLVLFGDRFYVELQRLGRSIEQAYLPASIMLAARRGVPVVATNDVRFLRPEDFEAHEARVCIREASLLADAARPRRYSPQQYLRSAEQMRALFADVPEALANTLQIARRCSLALALGKARLPDYPVPAGSSAEAEVRAQARSGLALRLQALASSQDAERYRTRL